MANDETTTALGALRHAAAQLIGAVDGVRPVLERMALERAVSHPAEPRNPEEHRHTYRQREVPKIIAGYEQAARTNKRRGDLTQIVIIVGSVGVTVTSGVNAAGFAGWGWFRWAATVLSAVVAGAAGISAYFKFRERAANARRTADEIEHEVTAAALGIGRYKDQHPDQVLETLVEEVERLRDEQRQREQQLEQRPEKQSADQARTA